MAEVVFDGVTKIYGDGTKAVDSLALDIADGEFMVLSGLIDRGFLEPAESAPVCVARVRRSSARGRRRRC